MMRHGRSMTVSESRNGRRGLQCDLSTDDPSSSLAIRTNGIGP